MNKARGTATEPNTDRDETDKVKGGKNAQKL